MRFRKEFLVVLIAIILFFSCSKKNTRLLMNEKNYYNKIEKEYKNGDYLDFRENANYFISDFPGSDKIPYIQYLIAESYFKEDRYAKAISEYNKIIYKYPDSEYLVDAYYKIGLSYFKQKLHPQRDQTNTQKAMYYLKKVLEQNSNKYTKETKEMINECRNTLAKKEYFRAKFYYRREAYDVSINILDEAIKEYSDTKTVANMYLLQARNYYEKKDKDKAYSYIKKSKKNMNDNEDIQEEVKDLQEELNELE